MIHFAVVLLTVLFFIAAMIHPQRLKIDSYSAFIFYVFGMGSYAFGQAITGFPSYALPTILSASVWIFFGISIILLIRELIENRL